jgi:site-specific DNA-methyltransferase (adenine-specific)
MKDIPDGSVDMILCDLPYGTIKGMQIDGYKNRGNNATEWDEVIDTKKLFSEYERILRMNGVAILFSQEPYTSYLRTFKSENFNFLYPMIWKKDHFANALISKKAPVSYFEDLNVFSKKYDKQNIHPLRKYFSSVMKFINASSCNDVNLILGHRRAEHCFYTGSTQFKLCTEKTYQELIDKLHINNMKCFKTFKELKQIDKKYQRVFNLQNDSKFIGNVLEFKKDYEGLHPTQKPVKLLEYLIKIYTNENDLVLDSCMGSGSTGVACLNTGRKFIGIEKDDKYFEISKERIGCYGC